jgi:hypothetical protein
MERNVVAVLPDVLIAKSSEGGGRPPRHHPRDGMHVLDMLVPAEVRLDRNPKTPSKRAPKNDV